MGYTSEYEFNYNTIILNPNKSKSCQVRVRFTDHINFTVSSLHHQRALHTKKKKKKSRKKSHTFAFYRAYAIRMNFSYVILIAQILHDKLHHL